MYKFKALLALCALALLASPAIAVNKSRLLAGVVDYNPGVDDGTVTTTFLSNPPRYLLTISSPQFDSGINGVNGPKSFYHNGGGTSRAARFLVPNFTSYTFDYTTQGNVNADDLLTGVIQNQGDGFFYGAFPTSTFNNGVFHATCPANAFTFGTTTLPDGASALMGDLLFFGGSDTQADSVTVSNFAVNGDLTYSVANRRLSFSTEVDPNFNFNADYNNNRTTLPGTVSIPYQTAVP